MPKFISKLTYKIKMRTLDYLLGKGGLREEAFDKLIGDAEIRTLHIEDSYNVEVTNCILYKSTIKNCSLDTFTHNAVKNSTITNNFMGKGRFR